MARRKREQAKRKRKALKAQKVKDEDKREIEILANIVETTQARHEELSRLTNITQQYKSSILDSTNERITFIAKTAINKHTFSAMEHLERELLKMREEEEFLLMAARILLNEQ